MYIEMDNRRMGWYSNGRKEAMARALDSVIAEHERNRFVLKATERCLKSGMDREDVYGTLAGSVQPPLFDSSYISALRRGDHAAVRPKSPDAIAEMERHFSRRERQNFCGPQITIGVRHKP
jgi:hypothetical protein